MLYRGIEIYRDLPQEDINPLKEGQVIRIGGKTQAALLPMTRAALGREGRFERINVPNSGREHDRVVFAGILCKGVTF